MRSAVTALGVCAAEPRGEEPDAEEERRQREQLLADLGQRWAGRDGRRRRKLLIFRAAVSLEIPTKDLAELCDKHPRTIRRIVSEVREGLGRYYRRPIGEPIEELLGLDPDRGAA